MSEYIWEGCISTKIKDTLVDSEREVEKTRREDMAKAISDLKDIKEYVEAYDASGRTVDVNNKVSTHSFPAVKWDGEYGDLRFYSFAEKPEELGEAISKIDELIRKMKVRLERQEKILEGSKDFVVENSE